MSHHLDTPLAAKNGQLFIDDLYVFPGHDSTVFVMDVNSSITGVRPAGLSPRSALRVEGALRRRGLQALTYRVAFGEPDADGRQPLQLHVLTGPDAREDSAIGELVLEGRTGETATGTNARLWAGRITDAFYIDLSLLAKVNSAVRNGVAPDLSDWNPERAKNSFASTTVEAIVLEVSHQHPQLRPRARIGVWVPATRHRRRRLAADQPRRAPDDVADLLAQTTWTSQTPARPGTRPKTSPPSASTSATRSPPSSRPAEPRDDPHRLRSDVARELFPDMLPYAVGTPATYGFAARNGRTLADNAPEAMLSLVSGMAVPSGLKPVCRQEPTG